MVLRLSFPPNPPPIRFTRHTTRLAGTPSALATRAWGKHSTLFCIITLQSTIYHIINNPIIFFATNELTILNERNHQYFVTLLSPFLCLVQFQLCFDWECGYKLISCTVLYREWFLLFTWVLEADCVDTNISISPSSPRGTASVQLVSR